MEVKKTTARRQFIIKLAQYSINKVLDGSSLALQQWK
jgi:hypothetical protein